MRSKILTAMVAGILVTGSALHAEDDRAARKAEVEILRHKFAVEGRRPPPGPALKTFRLDSLKVAIADIDDAFVKNGLLAADASAPDSDITIPFSADFVARNFGTCDYGYFQDDPARQVLNGGYFPSPEDRTQLLLMCKIYWSGYLKGAAR